MSASSNYRGRDSFPFTNIRTMKLNLSTGRTSVATVFLGLLASFAVSCATHGGDSAAPPNTLTPEEKAAGWRLLWDGKTSNGWRSAKAETFPTNGWVIKDSVLTVLGNGGKEAAGPGDIITRERF